MTHRPITPRASRRVGSFLVIMITRATSRYIAQVIEEEPLVLKVEEFGPYARLKGEDFVIIETDSLRAQGDDETAQELLREAVRRGKPLRSGLRSLGVKSGKLHEILPVE